MRRGQGGGSEQTGVREEIVLIHLAAAVEATDQLVEGEAPLVEIAAARERSERTIPPERWMDRSHCRGDVQWQE